LDLSKIEAGKLELDPRDCDLETLVHDVAEIMSHAARTRGLGLTCQLVPEACVVVRCDENRLRQVLVNLVSNAIKFTTTGGVTVTVDRIAEREKPVRLRFAVSDTGVGIPVDQFDRLFTAFSQVDSSTTRRFGGTGLGLSICKQLVELMGGEIGLESQVGIGTTFWFEIEMATADSTMVPERKRPSPSGARSMAMDGSERQRQQEEIPTRLEQSRKFAGHVLVAEDNSINQLYVVELLKHFGCTSDVVVNGEEALDAVQRRQYDLVLMDCQMPEMDGFLATHAIRKREASGERAGRIPIVALTANALKGDRERCLEAGMDEYLRKPLEGQELSAMLEKYLRSS
ncbi:MAG: ATP-binding protein, partial [Pirellulaceae bacterium]